MTQIDQKWSELKGSVRRIVNPDIDPDTKTSDLSRLTVAPWPMETLNKSNRDYTREPRTSTLLRNFREPPTRNFPNANTFIFSYLGAVSGGQTNLFQNKEKFLLFGQIEHKRRLIEKMIDPDLEIIMVSHSIGSFMMLHLMENRPMITRAFGLMPTIENMEEAPEGQKMTFHFSNSILIISLIFYIIRLLPFFIRDFIVKVCTHFTVRRSTSEF